jgi:SGNH hydrolase-like domain, acetyltransferase AlgX
MIRLSERVLLALIIATFLLPALLTIWVHFANPPPQFDWIANRTLYGVTVEKKIPSATLASWLTGELQKGLNTLASENFAGRELLIRLYDQVLYQVFHKSYMYLEYIIRGRHGNLFERNYLVVHGRYPAPLPKEEAEALAVMMKYLSDRLKELGSCFVLLITPNKATLYPEDIPNRFLEKIRSGDQQPTDYEIMAPFLKSYEIPFVDGRQITLEHRDALPVRAFPKTGTHWSRAVAYFTAVDLLKMIGRESGREMPQLTQSIESIDRRPDYADDDLWSLLNLIQKPGQWYLHPGFQIPSDWPKRTGILTIVGGSFVGEIVSVLEVAQVFAQINYYYYFKLSRRQFPGEIVTPVDENAIPWKEDFWHTKGIVLEENETAVNARHVHAFLMSALAALQQKDLPARKLTGPPRPLSWGFGESENGTALIKKGFGKPEHQLTWITGQDAEIEFPSPGVNTELQLIMEATPFLGDGVPQRTVNVQANGAPLGTLTLADPEIQFYSLTIKAAANSAPILKLHFSFSPVPNNPNPVDSQPRQIGLARLALVPLGHPVEQPAGTTDTTALTRQNP